MRFVHLHIGLTCGEADAVPSSGKQVALAACYIGRFGIEIVTTAKVRFP